jgi:GntR family transcriptional regulator/MocR family aminotransferase
VRGAAAGMHVLLSLDPAIDDRAVVEAAAARDVRVRALSPLHVEPGSERGLLIGYGRLPEELIETAVARLADALRDVTGPLRR